MCKFKCYRYFFKPTDVQAVFDDLSDKLTSLYGEIADSRQWGSAITTTTNTWYGATGTMVMLRREKYESGNDELYICYGSQNGNELIEAAYQGAIREELNNAASNTDGL